ncbi:hypothetical protein T265_11018 [Opisthorchis viverrini]|uniref:BHLH domain-containing protein n=2 Tax=Opisthorchis viverrini TaxID=6198 RepID=A0A074Z070_OPIVI|nr:hypothetical protein T265_11018 [Opisthorchis viverrini]KER20436.1 hypothetical protein T265_11018 [Opisthorchis viverrini]
MEQYDVYSSRNGLSGATVSLPRSHGKYKRDKGEFGNDDLKMIALKVPRQSSPNSDVHLVQQADTSAMSVLPRLLRTMTNGSGRENTGVANTAASGHALLTDGRGGGDNITTGGCIDNNNHPNVAPGHNITETDSSSSSSSFISAPSSGSNSSFISFIAPGQLGSVAAMAAAAALNSPGTASSVAASRETPESAGLVTLATASTMLEKEWLVRTAFATDSTTSTTNSSSSGNSGDGTSAAITQPTIDLPQTTTELVTLTVDHGADSNPGGSPPMLFRTLTSTSPHSQLNGSTPVTRAVLNVQGLAALIRETQKQRSASNTPVELPQNSILPVTSDTGVSHCSDDTRIVSPSHLGTSSTPTLLTLAPVTQSSANTTAVTGESTENPVLSAETNADSVSTQPTAFISLQPAPGSLLSSSDLQQLMASGEFMNSARQTLLGQSPDGSTRQLYLLVPSDYPVIMSRNSTNQTGSNVSPSSPLMETNTSGAPILEAISPGIEPEENGNPLPNLLSSVRSPQPVTMALPQLAGAVLAPMSSTSTALSTLIAGLDARNQAQHARYSSAQTATVPASSTSTSPSSWSNTNSIVQTTDSSRIRLPINLPGLSLSDHNIISTDQSSYSSLAGNRISTLLGSVKSDPDMYTPNGHPYPSVVEDSDLSTSILLPQSTLLNTTSLLGGSASVANAGNGNNNSNSSSNTASGVVTGTTGGNPPNADAGINTHFLPSPNLSRVNSSFNPNGLSVSTSGPGSKVVDECRRNMAGNLLSTSTNGRNDQSSAAYLEHLNPESKDIRRRVSHNEVERRRRDRINTWISELYKLLPPDEQAKSQYQSKGIVLKRVCEYFQNVDSMLKAANAAVEQTRVENGLLRQRNRELQQENQLLSASLHLGAAAAAAHLKNRQPRAPLHPNPEDSNGAGPGDNSSGTQLKEPNETADYPATVTVFAVNPNTDYGHGSNFSQASSTGLLPNQSVPSASFATVATLNNGNSGVFTLHTGNTSVGSSNTSMVNNTLVRPLTLPSLDLVANHSDSRPE